MLPRGTWQVSLTAAWGTFGTSHVATCPDVAPECSHIEIPPHRHEVELELFHTNLYVGYGAGPNLLVSARLPWDRKHQTVVYQTLDGAPYVPPYGDIHHRTETLMGFGDAEILVSTNPVGYLVVGAGISIPIGRTEPNPIELGRQGITHEHIQFGSGTVDPRLFVQWSRIFGKMRLTAAADGRFPLYENSSGFKAPVSIRWVLGPSLVSTTVGVALEVAGQYQSIGRWDGEQDEGTGFTNGGLLLRGSVQLGHGWQLLPGVYREVYSRSLSDESFRQGTTFSLTLSRIFR
jgi:hypothetical protein